MLCRGKNNDILYDTTLRMEIVKTVEVAPDYLENEVPWAIVHGETTEITKWLARFLERVGQDSLRDIWSYGLRNRVKCQRKEKTLFKSTHSFTSVLMAEALDNLVD